MVEKGMKRTDELVRGDDKWAHLEEEVAVVSLSAGDQQWQTMRKAVAFSKQPAKAAPIENMTPKTIQGPNLPQKMALALDA